MANKSKLTDQQWANILEHIWTTYYPYINTKQYRNELNIDSHQLKAAYMTLGLKTSFDLNKERGITAKQAQKESLERMKIPHTFRS